MVSIVANSEIKLCFHFQVEGPCWASTALGSVSEEFLDSGTIKGSKGTTKVTLIFNSSKYFTRYSMHEGCYIPHWCKLPFGEWLTLHGWQLSQHVAVCASDFSSCQFKEHWQLTGPFRRFAHPKWPLTFEGYKNVAHTKTCWVTWCQELVIVLCDSKMRFTMSKHCSSDHSLLKF